MASHFTNALMRANCAIRLEADRGTRAAETQVMRNILSTLVLGAVLAVAGSANASPHGGGGHGGGGGGHFSGGAGHFSGGGGHFVGHEGHFGGGHEIVRGGWHGGYGGWHGGWGVGVGVRPAWVGTGYCDPYYYDCGYGYAPAYVAPAYVGPRVVVGPRYVGPRAYVRRGWRR